MADLHLLLYGLCIVLCGVAFLAAVSGRLGLCSFGPAILIGAGVTAFLLFYLDLCNVRPRGGAVALVASVAAFVVVSLAIFRQVRFNLCDGGERFHWHELLALAPLGLAIYVLVAAWVLATHETTEWDAWSFWLFKAKVIAAQPLLPAPDIFRLPSFNYTHPGYPLLWPILAAGAWGATGAKHDMSPQLLQWLVYAGYFLTLYASLRWKLGRLAAVTLAAIGFALPPVMHWAAVGYADVMLATFYAGMIYFLARWADGGSIRDMVTCGFLAATMAFTKNEGLALGAIAAVIVFAVALRNGPRSALRDGVVFAVVFLLPLIPWFVFASGAPVDPDNYAHRFMTVMPWHNMARLGRVAGLFGPEFLQWHRWGPLWPLLIVSGIIGWRAWKKRHVQVVWTMLMLQFLLYVYIFMITSWDPKELAHAALERLFIQMTPAAVLLIGWQGVATAYPSIDCRGQPGSK